MKIAKIDVKTSQRNEMIDVTRQVQQALTAMGAGDGICTVFSLHTTGGITVNENADPDVQRDMLSALARIVPESAGYRHAEGNSDAHVKTSLVGLSAAVPVQQGRLLLGTWQGVYFCEFDGPRRRNLMVTLLEG